jgi:polyhydroxyalkanoate synthesis regulator phasin
MAAKKSTGKARTRKSSGARSASSARTGASRSSTPTTGLDKSVESFRESLESTFSRERFQDIADDFVERGRMTRSDAEKMVSDLVSRSRKQTDNLVKELDRLVKQARKEARRQAAPVRKQAGRAARQARDAVDPALAQADRLRRRAGVPSPFPITAYDQLTAAQIKSRLRDLTPAELRKVRDYEKRNGKRKGVISAVEKKLG